MEDTLNIERWISNQIGENCTFDWLPNLPLKAILYHNGEPKYFVKDFGDYQYTDLLQKFEKYLFEHSINLAPELKFIGVYKNHHFYLREYVKGGFFAGEQKELDALIENLMLFHDKAKVFFERREIEKNAGFVRESLMSINKNIVDYINSNIGDLPFNSMD